MNIIELTGLAALVAGSFVATNLDNLLLMVVLISANPGARLNTVFGFLVSAVIILAISCLGILVGANVNPGLLGYLGIVPLFMGVQLLYRQYAQGETATADSAPIVRGGWVAATVLMLSNSGDTLAIFFPLLAESSARMLWWEIGFFLLMALAWAMLALLVSGNLGATRRVVQMGNRLVPWVMLGAGAYILLNTATDSLL